MSFNSIKPASPASKADGYPYTISPKQAAEISGLSLYRIYHLCRDGSIPCLPVDKTKGRYTYRIITHLFLEYLDKLAIDYSASLRAIS